MSWIVLNKLVQKYYPKILVTSKTYYIHKEFMRNLQKPKKYKSDQKQENTKNFDLYCLK